MTPQAAEYLALLVAALQERDDEPASFLLVGFREVATKDCEPLAVADVEAALSYLEWLVSDWKRPEVSLTAAPSAPG